MRRHCKQNDSGCVVEFKKIGVRITNHVTCTMVGNIFPGCFLVPF